ncbi:glycosyltransferase [Arthrobacter flavus]|uniref:D-inositol 3-phosphate glycosyltransferase n=1 Tax=Arthrobacter flavus TaxID=95172 RepID=A0ABW4QBJ5_9MICC
MRIAITKSTLRIPPTYFATAHAELLSERFDFEAFTLVADVRDPSVRQMIRQAVPFPQLGFRPRELIMPAFMPLMTRAIRNYHPDVIHQHFATWSLPAVRASRGAGTPLLTTLHGADVMVFSKPAATAQQRWHHLNVRSANQTSSRLLAVSGYLADRAVSAGMDASKIVVHYQGIDTDYFVPQARDDRDREAPVLLFVGALNEQKGARDLLKASLELIKTQEHQVRLVGQGPLESELRALADNSPHVTFLSPLGRAGVRREMQLAHCLVAPSQQVAGTREAAGLVLLEAQACATPVVAYDSGGISEMVSDETGQLISEGHVNELTSALSELLTMPVGDKDSMNRRARDFVVEHRSLQRSSTELADHYTDVAR